MSSTDERIPAFCMLESAQSTHSQSSPLTETRFSIWAQEQSDGIL